MSNEVSQSSFDLRHHFTSITEFSFAFHKSSPKSRTKPDSYNTLAKNNPSRSFNYFWDDVGWKIISREKVFVPSFMCSNPDPGSCVIANVREDI